MTGHVSPSRQPAAVPCSCAETPPLGSGCLRSSVSLRPAHPPWAVVGELEALALGKEPEPREGQEQMLKRDGGGHKTSCSHPLGKAADTPSHKTSFSRAVKAENRCHATRRKLTQPAVTCKLQMLGDLLYWEPVQEKTTSGRRASCRSCKKESALGLARSRASILIKNNKKLRIVLYIVFCNLKST